jgi:hypothetical protein
VRLADEVKRPEVASRACVRITNAGVTVASFLSESELASVRGSLGAILG